MMNLYREESLLSDLPEDLHKMHDVSSVKCPPQIDVSSILSKQVSLLFLLLNVITTQALCRALGNDTLLLTGFDFC